VSAPFCKLSNALILGSQEDRRASGRPASVGEAYCELAAMYWLGRLSHMSQRALAEVFGWSRKRLARQLGAWAEAGVLYFVEDDPEGVAWRLPRWARPVCVPEKHRLRPRKGPPNPSDPGTFRQGAPRLRPRKAQVATPHARSLYRDEERGDGPSGVMSGATLVAAVAAAVSRGRHLDTDPPEVVEAVALLGGLHLLGGLSEREFSFRVSNGLRGKA